MNKNFVFVWAIVVAPLTLVAQNGSGEVGSEVDSEIDSLYQSANVNNNSSPVIPAPSRSNSAGQPIYIVNQATPTSSAQVQTQQQVQQQPTTFVEATPLVESRAEQIRRARKSAEIATEQKIVEKLEASRMEDERRRAESLFGDRFASPAPSPATSSVPPVSVVVAPSQSSQSPDVDRDLIREEIRAAQAIERTVPETSWSRNYITGLAGLTEYPGVNNVRGNYTLGFNMGSVSEGLVIEGGFTYSNFSVDQLNYFSYLPSRVDVNQYQGHFAAKLEIDAGRVKPFAGGIAALSYRSYTWDRGLYSPTPYGYSQDQSANSTSVDMGVTGGVDLHISPKMAVGLDMKYMFNLTNRRSNDRSIYYNSSNYAYGKPLEELNYYSIGVGLKYLF
jgi:hypothetical protein